MMTGLDVSKTPSEVNRRCFYYYSFYRKIFTLNINIMNILKFIESFSTEDLMNVKGSRRDIFSQVGIGKNAALITIPFGIASVTSTKASAAVKKPKSETLLLHYN
jgi:hypothetical protein